MSAASSELAIIINDLYATFSNSLKGDIANTLACSIVGSPMDYCNVLLFKANDKLICKLQRVQGNPARLICDTNTRFLYDSSRTTVDLFHDLNWLPISSRTTSRLCWCLTRDLISVNRNTYPQHSTCICPVVFCGHLHSASLQFWHPTSYQLIWTQWVLSWVLNHSQRRIFTSTSNRSIVRVSASSENQHVNQLTLHYNT